ncbi:S1 RNA-binding domain-containing protein, partial [bacterium]|nr:S1 RNA-binding domain-containing protein [bacterium]MBU1024368.1 S1 RNA-binding domain-containing protein [bacterium]
VPIAKPVSGIAMGLITDDKGNFKVLSDLMGTEDFMGDMDFKVTGSSDGITAIQMDTKIEGLTHEMIAQILKQAHDGRAYILQKMLDVIPAPREDLSPYAPRIIILRINPEKIGDVIGPGGKTVRKIIEETGVEIDIEDDGRVYITSNDAEAAKKAKEIIESLTEDVEPGKIYKGKVVRLEDYGAFVQVIPGKDGLLHISRIAQGRINNIRDVFKMGQELNVKVAGIDEMGRVDLTTVDVLQEDGKPIEAPENSFGGSGGGSGGGGYNRGRDDRNQSRGGDRRPSGSRPPRRDSRNEGERSDNPPKRDKYDR